MRFYGTLTPSFWAFRGNVAVPNTATGNCKQFLAVALDPKKSQPMATRIAHIGVILEFTHLLHQGDVLFPPEPGRVAGMSESFDNALSETGLTRTKASSLTGKLRFLSSHTAGVSSAASARERTKRGYGH